MKSIIYLLLTVMLGSIVYSAIPGKKQTLGIYKQEVILESVNTNLSADALKTSAEIISKRLETYGLRLFSIYPDYQKMQLVINFKNEQNVIEIADLLTQKGKFEIAETAVKSEVLTNIDKSDSVYNYLQISQDNDFEKINPKLGKCKPENAEKLARYMSRGAFQVRIPSNIRFAWGKVTVENAGELSMYCLRTNYVNRFALDSLKVSGAEVQQDGKSNYALNLNFDEKTSQKWQELTKANLHKPLALVIDNYVYAAPIVNSEIKGGKCIITGQFTKEELGNLAGILKNGVLPTEFMIKK